MILSRRINTQCTLIFRTSLRKISRYFPVVMKLSLTTGEMWEECGESYNLLDHPTAVYSGMRTIRNGQFLVELDSHLERLRNSAVGAFGEKLFNGDLQTSLKERFPPFLKFVCSRLQNPSGNDMKFVVILDRENFSPSDFYILCKTDVLMRPPEAVEVDVTQLTRHNPCIKSVDWVIQRQGAEEAKRGSSNEVILSDEQGNLYEGLSSNFGVIDCDGTFITASGDHVLGGTIMKVAKAVASDKVGIPVREEFPSLHQLSRYQYAFITSTSRLMLPISKMYLPDGSFVEFACGSASVYRTLPSEGVQGRDEAEQLQQYVEENDCSLISILKREVEAAVIAGAYDLTAA